MRKTLIPVVLLCIAASVLGAGKEPRTGRSRQAPKAPAAATPAPEVAPATPATAPAPSPAPAEEPATASGPKGPIAISVVDVRDNPLAARVEFQGVGRPVVVEVPNGKLETTIPVGTYKAYVYAYEEGLPLLIGVHDVSVASGKPASVSESLLEGTSGKRLLREFDRDFDLAIDRVELAVGTDPADPTSIPGRSRLSFPEPVIAKKRNWYRGELHAQSKYGRGKESVRELVKRAEALGLDFLAICDPNTLAAAQDPEFKSSSVVLIPAMAWGDDKNGYALIYGPKTMPERAETVTQAQAVARLVQAQGGVFAAAHPCFPGMSWQWGVRYINAVEVWTREWNRVPPIQLAMLQDALQLRTRDGGLVHSIAAAANTGGLSANGQAALFWDYETLRGVKIAPIAGSMTGSPTVPMAEPVTYVMAEEKSVRGILDGIRAGRTYVSSSINGPNIAFEADAMRDNRVDVSMGGAVPVGVETRFTAAVSNALGKKIEIIRNGRPMGTFIVGTNKGYVVEFTEKPEAYSVYRLRVGEPAGKDGYGPTRVLAMSSPIYAQDIIILTRGMTPNDVWLKVQDEQDIKSGDVPPPVYATGITESKGDGDAPVWVQIDKNATPMIPQQRGSGPNIPFDNPKAFEMRPPTVPSQPQRR